MFENIRVHIYIVQTRSLYVFAYINVIIISFIVWYKYMQSIEYCFRNSC